MNLEIIDQDLGLNDLIKKFEKASPRAVLVGITEDSPRRQFRRGTDQEFRPETASLLIRQPIDAREDQIRQKLAQIGRNALLEGVDPDVELKKLGEEIKADMGRQTDPPPQLRNAIIVKIEE